MGRHLPKEEYRKRAMRIVYFRDVDKMLFSEIAERMNVFQWTVERSYRQVKEGKI
jgi:DNA-binding transcriptional regulator LsrR (DeoR family)